MLKIVYIDKVIPVMHFLQSIESTCFWLVVPGKKVSKL